MKCNPILLSCYVGMLLGFTDAAATTPPDSDDLPAVTCTPTLVRQWAITQPPAVAPSGAGGRRLADDVPPCTFEQACVVTANPVSECTEQEWNNFIASPDTLPPLNEGDLCRVVLCRQRASSWVPINGDAQHAVTQGGVNNLISSGVDSGYNKKYATVVFDANGGNYFPELQTCIFKCMQQPACTHVVLLDFNVDIGDQGCATTGFTLTIEEPTPGDDEEQVMQVNEWYKVYQVEEAFSMDTQHGCMDLAIGDSPYKGSKQVDCGDACNMNCETEVNLKYSYSGGSVKTKQFQIVNDGNGYVTATRTDSFGWTLPLTIQCCGSLSPSVEQQTFVPTCGKPVYGSANRYSCGFSHVYNDNAATQSNPSDAVCCVINQNAKCASLVESACGYGRVKNLATAGTFCNSNPCTSYDQHCCKDDVSEQCGTCEALNRRGCLQGSTDCGGCKPGYTANALSACEEKKVVRTHTAKLIITSGKMSSEDQEQGRNVFKAIVANVENVHLDKVVVTSTEGIVSTGSGVTIASYIFEGVTTTLVRDTDDVKGIVDRITSDFENSQFFTDFKGKARLEVGVVDSDICSQRVLDVCADLGRFGCYPNTYQCGECMHGSRLEGGKCKSVPILTRNDTSALQAVMMLAGIIIGIAGAVAFIYRSSILSWFRTATQDKGRRVGQVAISSNIHSNPLNLISRAPEKAGQVGDTYQTKPPSSNPPV